MFDELDLIEKIGNLLQGNPGLAGQIGWGLLMVIGFYKVIQAVADRKMDWGEAGKKLEEMFKQFQWRLEGNEENKNKGGGTIKAIDLDGNTVYSYSEGGFHLISRNKMSNVTPLLSRREAKRLAKLRKQVVSNLVKSHKENSTAALVMEVERFLLPAPAAMANKIGAKTAVIPAVQKQPVHSPVGAKMVEAAVKSVAANYPAATPKFAGIPELAPVHIGNMKPAAPAVPVAKVVEVNKIVVACPACRTTRAIIKAGHPGVLACPTCKIGKDNAAPQLIPTSSDPKEFIDQNTAWTPTISMGSVFKNYKSTSGQFRAQPWYNHAPSGYEVCKQPTESFKDQAAVLVYKELKNKEKQVAKAAEVAKPQENKVVDAGKLFPAKESPVLAKISTATLKEETKPPVKAEEPKPVIKSEYTLYCCPKCRITRAIVKNGHEAILTCKNDDCDGEKLVKTTGNAEEFVTVNGEKVTDFLRKTGSVSVRFRNYGTEKGDKFVAVLLPMKTVPLHNGVKMTVKKQPSDSIVGYVKPVKKEEVKIAAKVEAPKPAEKTVTVHSKVKVEYTAGPSTIQTIWDFNGNESTTQWRNIRDMMKGMKVGETRIIPACKEDNGARNEQFTVTVIAII